MKLNRREALALSGLVVADAALVSRTAKAQMEHHHQGTPPQEEPVPAPKVVGPDMAPEWGRLVRGTAHPARTIEPGDIVPPGEPGRDYRPVVTPNGVALSYKIMDGVKVFHLIAEEIMHEMAPGLKMKLWGFNGRVHGPTIEAVEGDRIRIYVTNKLPEALSIHWHGIILPNGMDGVAGLNQKPIEPGETFKYEYPLVQYGTHMYHSHFDEMTQMALGVMGLFIIHPRRSEEPRPDRDFAFMLSEWDIKPGAYRPDPRVFAGFNMLTLNARAFPGTEPMVVKRGERVRIRLVNLGAVDHHPMHVHGHSFWVVQTDGGVIPANARWPETTVLVSVGQSRTVDFVADNPGDWAFHCHITHHVMNQMGHEGPNLIGVDAAELQKSVAGAVPDYMVMGTNGMGDMSKMTTGGGAMEHMHGGGMNMDMPQNSIPMMGGPGPFGTIDMGGMLTILKVRENLTSYSDPGWYQHPPGTLAQAASQDEMERDGIQVSLAGAKTAPKMNMPGMDMPGMKMDDMPGMKH